MNEGISTELKEWPELTKMWEAHKQGKPVTFNDILKWHIEAIKEDIPELYAKWKEEGIIE
jgi:hypothetical protein